jgi:N-hydroxyarylamine O-acetyltransferase
MDITSYLRRIDYRGRRDASRQVLRELHQLHLLTVPFENLDIHWGKLIQLDEDRLFEKIVTRRRGGFCYELNGLFAALLRELDFKVDLLSARVYKSEGIGPEFDHLVLRVRLEEDWLADVGFGDSFAEPLRLDEDAEQVQAGVPYRLEKKSKDLVLSRKDEAGKWEGLYRFSLQPRILADFKQMCRYHQSSPDSMFTQKQLCTRATPGGRVTMGDRSLIITQEGQRREKILNDENEYTAALFQYFGIREG